MPSITLLKLDAAAWRLLREPTRRQCPSVSAWRARGEDLLYVYLPQGAAPAALHGGLPQGVARVELRAHSQLDGAAAGRPPSVHYVVETDVEPGHDDELNAWYDQEHLPGLAAVPGTVRATRYVDANGSPRYYACYDLASEQAFNSPAWLAVRATDWSSRVRPRFRNTRRTMFDPAPF